jgi:hypothetical protein
MVYIVIEFIKVSGGEVTAGTDCEGMEVFVVCILGKYFLILDCKGQAGEEGRLKWVEWKSGVKDTAQSALKTMLWVLFFRSQWWVFNC